MCQWCWCSPTRHTTVTVLDQHKNLYGFEIPWTHVKQTVAFGCSSPSHRAGWGGVLVLWWINLFGHISILQQGIYSTFLLFLMYLKHWRDSMALSQSIWVTSTIFWSSQVHACCVHDTLKKLQKNASYLNQSLCILEKLLSQLGSSYRKPIAIWLHSWHF